MAKVLPKAAPSAKAAFEEPKEEAVDVASLEDAVEKEPRPGCCSAGGLVERIASNSYFESTTMGVIVFNALWMGIDTEWNHNALKDENGKAPLDPMATVIENFFCFYFTFELTVRFFAFRQKRQCFGDSWFVFDSVLVGCMIFETWFMVILAAALGVSGSIGPLGALRLLRLLRLARMGRLMRFVPELGKLVKGMVKAARSVVFILIFLVLIMYIFSIIFTGSFSDREAYPLTPYCEWELRHGQEESEGCLGEGEFGELGQDLFATMGDSFMSLFTLGVLGDNLDFCVQAILDESVILMWVFFVFLIITFATLLNMLIGVICEVISDAAAEEEQQENENLLRTTIEDAFSQIDLNADGTVSAKEWANIKDNDAVRATLVKIGLEEERLDERLEQMQNFIFLQKDVDEDGEQVGLTVEELTKKVVEMRPDADASALDLSLMHSQVAVDQKMFKKKLKKLQNMLNKHLREQTETNDNRKSQITKLKTFVK